MSGVSGLSKDGQCAARAVSDNQCTYTKNNQGGAALKITGGSAPRIVGNTFTGNVGKSLEGGAVYVDSSAPIFQDNKFSKNTMCTRNF